MRHVAVLATWNARMLRAFSDRTADALRGELPLRIALPHLEAARALRPRDPGTLGNLAEGRFFLFGKALVVHPHLEAFLSKNVGKEVRKDSLVIGCAGEAVLAGTRPGAEAVAELVQRTKDIDRAFLQSVDRFPVRIAIPYERILPLRMGRVSRLLETSYRILAAWTPGRGLRGALRAAYPRAEFEAFVLADLGLYAQETQALSHSVRLPGLLNPLRDRLARGLLETMAGVSRRLATELGATLYGAPGGPNAPR